MPVFHICMGEIKQVIVVRTDLDMGKGKIAAQVGHACVLGAEHVTKSHPEWFEQWWAGQEKVVVKVSGIKAIQEIKRHAIDFQVSTSLSYQAILQKGRETLRILYKHCH